MSTTPENDLARRLGEPTRKKPSGYDYGVSVDEGFFRTPEQDELDARLAAILDVRRAVVFTSVHPAE